MPCWSRPLLTAAECAGATLANIDELNRIIGDFIGKRTLEDNLEHFGALDVTVGPV